MQSSNLIAGSGAKAERTEIIGEYATNVAHGSNVAITADIHDMGACRTDRLTSPENAAAQERHGVTQTHNGLHRKVIPDRQAKRHQPSARPSRSRGHPDAAYLGG